jgi:putative CRISPR-associated protein (TIGR02619 family)
MRTIICTTGTSIAFRIPYGEEKNYRQAIQKRLAELRSDPDDKTFLIRVSAESNSLHNLKTTQEDRVVFLHTETPDGKICTEEVKRLIDRHMGVSAQLREIEGLQVKDAKRFRQVGIQSLFATLDELCGPLLDNPNEEVILNATGGFKSVVPYITLYGLLYRLPVVYIFETSETLLSLPPAPIHFDYERLHQAMDAMVSLQEQGVMKKEAFFEAIPGLGYHDREWYESLLEEDEQRDVTLSAFGMLLLKDLTHGQAEVLISPQAQRTYEESEGVAKEQFTFMLERAGNPLWRQGKKHSFHGTDLAVYKPGNTAERMACIMRPGKIFVCELFAAHDDYERILPQKHVSDYDLKSFQQWYRPVGIEASPTTEEAAFRRLYKELDDSRISWHKAEDQLEAVRHEKLKLEDEKQTLQDKIEGLQAKAQRTVEMESEVQGFRARVRALEEELAIARLPWWKRLLKRGS